MLRTVIEIDEETCNGCGLCAQACHEGAIAIIDGRARLVRDDYCDGLGDCLPACPVDAIHFVEREAAAYDADAVARRKRESAAAGTPGGCPGARMRVIDHGSAGASTASAGAPTAPSRLENWPVQIKLAPIQAPYFSRADLLISADCCAYAYGAFHRDYIAGRICLIGCPKLDGIDYTEKLSAIIAENDITSVTIVRMEVPCCAGLEHAVRTALQQSGKSLDCAVTTLSLGGEVLA